MTDKVTRKGQVRRSVFIFEDTLATLNGLAREFTLNQSDIFKIFVDCADIEKVRATAVLTRKAKLKQRELTRKKPSLSEGQD